MCEYCGCHQNQYLAQLMDEHDVLNDLGDRVRRALDAGDSAGALEAMGRFSPMLAKHTDVEERGVFTAMRDAGEFTDAVDALEEEHRDLEAVLAELEDPEVLAQRLDAMLSDLHDHIEKENRGLFPAAYVTLSTEQWVIVSDAHENAQQAHSHADGHSHSHADDHSHSHADGHSHT